MTGKTISRSILFLVCMVPAIAVIFGIRSYEGNMNNDAGQQKWLTELFRRSTIVCFGRYALEIPQGAELVVGGAWIPSEVDTRQGGPGSMERLVSSELERIGSANETSEVIYNGVGPLEGSWQIRYFKDVYKKRRNAAYFKTFVANGSHIFMMGDGISPGETEALVAERQARLANSVRELIDSEFLSEPGFCIENGFIADAAYSRQEMINVGIYFPQHPDISFSVSSNKDAYVDLTPEEFQKAKLEELPLLARIARAKELQGSDYPARTVIREGRKAVQHWHGQESLFRRDDGTHDFEWAFVGNPKDVANPSEFRIKMFTKVAHNTVGAADKSSLTDDEAVALWDKLLASLKFRVKVPGAPEGSYYFVPGEKASGGVKP